MKIAFFGSSILSAYWNGAATYYRGILRALANRGHQITFFEPDAYERQSHRDIEPPPWARVVVYDNSPGAALRCVEAARSADLVVKASGVGAFDELLEAAVLDLQRPGVMVVFWDVDAPATLDRMTSDSAEPFRALVPCYDLIFTYGGGPPVVEGYNAFGARECIPIYNGLDPETHHPVPSDRRFDCDLAFLGNRLPDREQRVEEFLLKAAAALPSCSFILGGNGWQDKALPGNVRALGHVYTADHNAFNSTPLAVLNVARSSMARYGFSPATRVFEAAGAGACLITDFWEGIDQFFTPDSEILVASNGAEVAEILAGLSREEAHAIGSAAYRHALAVHTYQNRANQVEHALSISASLV